MKYSIKDENSGSDLGFLLLTKAERQVCRERFQSYQKIGSLKLHKEEIRQLLKQLNKQPSEQQLMKMIFQGDPSGKQQIQYSAFQKIITQCKQQLQSRDNSQVRNAFEYLEKDTHNGQSESISIAAIQKMLKDNFKIDISPEMFMEYVGGKAEISYEEFKSLLES